MSEVSTMEELKPLALAAALLPGCSLGFTQIKPAEYTYTCCDRPKTLYNKLHIFKKICLHANMHALQMSK